MENIVMGNGMSLSLSWLACTGPSHLDPAVQARHYLKILASLPPDTIQTVRDVEEVERMLKVCGSLFSSETTQVRLMLQVLHSAFVCDSAASSQPLCSAAAAQ